MKSNKLAAEAVVATGEALRAAAAKYAAAKNAANAAKYAADMAHDDNAAYFDAAAKVAISALSAAWVEYTAAEEASITAYDEAKNQKP